MTGKKVFISIKNKIVFTLIAILISVTGFNLIYSYQMFKTDKETYIYENALRNGELATDKILDYIKRQSELLAKENMVQDPSFFFTGEYLPENPSEAAFLFNYNDEAFREDEGKIKRTIEGIVKSNKSALGIYSYEENIFLVLRQPKGFRFALISKKIITETLAKDNIFQYIVAGKDGSLLHGDQEVFPGFKKVTNPKSNQESKLIESGDIKYLVSYTRIKKLDLIVYSYIKQDKAFAIFKNIIFKNIAFTVIILGVFLILSLIFSKKLTTPILKLIDKTREIADGNLEGTIEVSTNDELKVLGSSVNIMSGKIKKLLDDKQAMIKELEVANAKLDEYNKNLESIVAERTKELRSANNFITAMINSLDQGLFVFNHTKKCLNIFTKACEDMFKKVPKDLDVVELLSLNEKEVEGFDKWSNVLFSNMMPFEGAKALGPKNVVTSEYGQGDFKYISLDYYPMKNEKDKLENVVVVATDKTAEVEAEERFKEKDAYVSMILNIIKNKKSFYEFLEEMEEMLVNLSNFDKHEDLENIAMIAFHSMNGGFANYSVSYLVKVARECESKIKSFVGNRSEFEQLLVVLIRTFREEREKTIKEVELQLANSKNIFEIDKDDLAEFKARIKNGEDPMDLYRDYFEKEKISSIFSPYASLVSQIGEKLGKPMTPLFVNGGDTRIDTSKIKEFSSSLVHLFRNCMDHGIEMPDKRVKIGKEEEGSINITAHLTPDNRLQLVIQDDGGGINITKIREILSGKGIEHTSLSDKQAMMYIFKPDFSTAEQLTELSGRGVGMSAVYQAVKNLNGKIDLESEMGKGSKFIFELPLS